MNKLYGLVVCGGQSSRMGTDKSLLEYHGQAQRYYMYDMLQGLCEQVYISCNAEQARSIPDKYATIVDAEKYNNIGPMAALLSAWEHHMDADWLVVGCDYPFVTAKDLQMLIDARQTKAAAMCYYNYVEQMEEPLLAVYTQDIKQYLLQQYHEGKYSLRHLLKDVNATKVLPTSAVIITSIDTPEAYQDALMQLKKG